MSDQTLAAKLKELGEKATPGEWFDDNMRVDGSNGRNDYYTLLFAPNGAIIADTLNSTCVYLEDSGEGRSLDTTGVANIALIVELKRNLPAIIAALERTAPATEGEVEAVAKAICSSISVDEDEGPCTCGPDGGTCCAMDLFGIQARAALSAARPREGEMRAALGDLCAALDELVDHGVIPCSDKLAKAYAAARAALQPQQQKEG